MQAYFDSLRLTKQERQYAAHYVQTNGRLAIVVIIVLCLFVLGMLIPESLVSLPLAIFSGSLIVSDEISAMAMFFVSICILAYLLPLFQFRFLMKRSHCDLYLSLPIERKRLFYVHYVIGLLFLISCALVEWLVIYALSGVKGNAWFTLDITVLLVSGIYILLGSCLYTFFVAFIMHCHRILDGILVCMIYTILPVLLYHSFSAFYYSIQEQVMNADVFFVTTNRMMEGSELGSYNIIFLFTSLLSIPWQMNCWLAVVNPSIVIYDETISFLLAALVAWMIIAGLCFLHARDKMVRLRGEMSEQPTRSLLAYRLLIPVMTLFIILGFGGGNILSLPILIIFVLYLLAYCFARRKITFDYRNVLVYLVIVLGCSAIYQIAVTTQCFHTAYEIPRRDQIKAMQVEISTLYDNEGYGSDYSQVITDPVIIDEWIQDHKAVVAMHQKLPRTAQWSTTVSFTYYYRDKTEVRTYQFTKEEEEKIRRLREKWYEKKYFESLDDEVTTEAITE